MPMVETVMKSVRRQNDIQYNTSIHVCETSGDRSKLFDPMPMVETARKVTADKNDMLHNTPYQW